MSAAVSKETAEDLEVGRAWSFCGRGGIRIDATVLVAVAVAVLKSADGQPVAATVDAGGAAVVLVLSARVRDREYVRWAIGLTIQDVGVGITEP